MKVEAPTSLHSHKKKNTNTLIFVYDVSVFVDKKVLMCQPQVHCSFIDFDELQAQSQIDWAFSMDGKAAGAPWGTIGEEGKRQIISRLHSIT